MAGTEWAKIETGIFCGFCSVSDFAKSETFRPERNGIDNIGNASKVAFPTSLPNVPKDVIECEKVKGWMFKPFGDMEDHQYV